MITCLSATGQSLAVWVSARPFKELGSATGNKDIDRWNVWLLDQEGAVEHIWKEIMFVSLYAYKKRPRSEERWQCLNIAGRRTLLPDWKRECVKLVSASDCVLPAWTLRCSTERLWRQTSVVCSLYSLCVLMKTAIFRLFTKYQSYLSQHSSSLTWK
jgi:hypothetical protein